MKRRKVFTREFKIEAVRLLEEGKKNPADLAREFRNQKESALQMERENRSAWWSGLPRFWKPI